MATRLKTIEYVWNTDTSSIVGNVGQNIYTSPVLNIYIPETGSREIQCAWLEFYCRDKYPSGTTHGNGGMQERKFKLSVNGSQSAQFVHNSYDHISDTGEQLGLIFTQPFTSHLQTYMPASLTQSALQYTFEFTGSTTASIWTNLGGKFYITYKYDDANGNVNRRVRTARIPLDKSGSFAASFRDLVPQVPNQVPVLDTFCPEANKTFRNIWFEVEGQEYGGTTTTDYILSMSLDNEEPTGIAFFEMASALSNYEKLYYVRNSMDTSTTHSVNFGGPSANAYQLTSTVLLCATYEYDHQSSTRVLNSVMVPMTGRTLHSTPSVDVNVPSIAYQNLNIQEPGTITLLQSGYNLYSEHGADNPFYHKMNTGSYQRLNYVTALPCSKHYSMRVDTGSYYSMSVNIQKGYNPFYFYFYGDGNATNVGNPTLTLYLNYSSDKHPLGDGVHNHSVMRLMNSGSLYVAGALIHSEPVDQDLSLPETNYYISNQADCLHHIRASSLYGWLSYSRMTSGSAALVNVPDINTLMSTNPVAVYSPSGERGNIRIVIADEMGRFRKYPQQIPDFNKEYGTLDGLTCNQLMFGDAWYYIVNDLVTYHGITYSVTGSLSGYGGDGSGIPVGLFRSDTRDLITTGSTSTGGSYSFTWYDNTIPVFVEALDGTNGGRSQNLVAQ